MSTFVILAILAVIAFLIAWVTNGFAGLVSGERPRDTGRLWFDSLLRSFALLELGWIGRTLNHVGLTGLPRKVVLFIGLLGVLLFLVRACHHDHHDDSRYIRSYPVQSP